jgi:small subunit ribosomal protein S2
LTNFREIGRKLKELQSLNNFIQKDSFKNLIKKEQASIEKRRNKLLGIYEGVVNIKKQPDALFIIGMNKEKTAFKEAKKLEMPVIAVCNTNCNPKFVDFVIPGNDEGVKSIEFFSKIVSDSIRERNNPESLDKRKENLEKEISK